MERSLRTEIGIDIFLLRPACLPVAFVPLLSEIHYQKHLGNMIEHDMPVVTQVPLHGGLLIPGPSRLHPAPVIVHPSTGKFEVILQSLHDNVETGNELLQGVFVRQ